MSQITMHALHHARAAIERRQAVHREDSLTSAYYVVESLDSDTLAAILRETLGQPLDREAADVVQLAAQRAGVQVAWRHYKFNSDTWGEGRGQ